MTFSRALVVFAHPDDAEFGTAGTVAKWTAEGTEVTYVCVTDGSAGSNEPGLSRADIAKMREPEQRAAAETLGVRECVFLGIPDGEVEVWWETPEPLLGLAEGTGSRRRPVVGRGKRVEPLRGRLRRDLAVA